MGYKMKGFPKIEGAKGKGKNYESSKGDQQGPIPENNIKLQPSENPDTYVYEADVATAKGKTKKASRLKARAEREETGKSKKDQGRNIFGRKTKKQKAKEAAATKKFVESERINDLEDRKSFIQEDEFNSGKSTKQQKKDKKTLEREAEIMRDRSKNKAGKKSYYANE